MKILPTLIALFIAHALSAQSGLTYTGKQFIALSVPNAVATSQWYEDVFGLKLIKEIQPPGGKIHVRIVGNDWLLVEILQNADTKTLADCGVASRALLPSYFKAGFYVSGLAKAKEYLDSKKVVIKNGPYEDKEIKSKSMIIEDVNGYLIQLFEAIK